MEGFPQALKFVNEWEALAVLVKGFCFLLKGRREWDASLSQAVGGGVPVLFRQIAGAMPETYRFPAFEANGALSSLYTPPILPAALGIPFLSLPPVSLPLLEEELMAPLQDELTLAELPLVLYPESFRSSSVVF